MGSDEQKNIDPAARPRSPGPSYQDLLDKESNPVPDCLRDSSSV